MHWCIRPNIEKIIYPSGHTGGDASENVDYNFAQNVIEHRSFTFGRRMATDKAKTLKHFFKEF